MEKEISYSPKVLGSPSAAAGGDCGRRESERQDPAAGQHACSALEQPDHWWRDGVHRFWKAQGHKIGSSMCEEDKLDLARSLLKKAEDRKMMCCCPWTTCATPNSRLWRHRW
ncbi:hypothetical protein TcBrA4_0036750 [Trypanosoma cruzi]|nr:hypothetical protein TcBrA4_0036750 [Trypanosoma cruzi]